jgi:hypothetical protein
VVRPRRYDLADRADRARVYEQVLTEGTDDDVRLYVVLAELIDLCQNLCCRTTSAAGGRDGSTRGAARRHCDGRSPLQEQVGRIATSLPEAHGFALAGGAALDATRVVDALGDRGHAEP